MKEVKSPKRSLLFYYLIVMAILLIFNLIIAPMIEKQQIEEVGYGTFLDMINAKEVGQVEVGDDEITFTNKDNTKIYRTGAMNDPELTDRLYESGAEFTKISTTTSPWLSFLLSFLLPLTILILLGQ